MTNYAPDGAYNFCMDIIYIDRLFFLNLGLDYLLVLCSARLCGIKLRRQRYALAAVPGAVYAVLSVVPSLGFMTLAPVKLVFGVLMALIAYGGEEKLLRCCLVFFAVSALFGGAVWAISLQNGGSIGSTAYISVSLPVLVISFALIYAVLSFVFRRSVKSADISVSEAELTLMGRSVYLRCLRDSGNALFDPVSGDCVLIVPAERLEKLFPSLDAGLLSSDCTRLMTEPSLAGRLRLIPYSAVGTSGMLAAFRPDSIVIDGRSRDDIIVAISPTPVGGDGFEAII